MPCLITAASNETFDLNRRLTSIGPHRGNHIVVHGTPNSDTYAHVLLDKGRYLITTLERSVCLNVNGKKTRKHVLEHGDNLELEGTKLEFNLWKSAAPAAPVNTTHDDILGAYQKLNNFCRRLAEETKPQGLIDVLMDQVIELSGADKGFLLYGNEASLEIKSARNVNKESLGASRSALSDSIIQSVLAKKEPIIVSDALTDAVFSSSASVLDLKLCSVMCTPLLIRGELLGIIYLGNDNVVNLFTRQSLDILTIFASQAALLLKSLIVQYELKADNEKLKAQVKRSNYGQLIGSSPPMLKIFARIERIAPTNVNVLVLGETGTGKELVAREIHQRSDRANGPFVALNCGALPENLMESEIFGHTRGAFTGAIADKKGCFETAQGGTLFLDEVGDMPATLQVKLLRAIQERKVTRVGDSKPRDVDIRLIAATHVNLEDAIAKGQFREDLYYRINVVNLNLPPLRERGDDILVIAQFLLRKFSEEFNRPQLTLSPECQRAILKHTWVGNVRELENRLKKAALLSDADRLTPEALELDSIALSNAIKSLAQAKEDFQSSYIDHVLALNNFNRTKTAKDLDVDPRTIFRHLEKKRDNNLD